jgi:surface polysaccharide O-acyltransferase-like enzyme
MLNSGVIHSLLEIAVHVTGSIAAFEVFRALAERIDWNKAWFEDLSSKTMPMYLFHQQIIYFMIYWLNGKVNPYIHAGISFIVALVCSFIISSVLMHWKVTRFLIVEKA